MTFGVAVVFAVALVPAVGALTLAFALARDAESLVPAQDPR
jgi:hypothetical protein